MSKRVDHQRFSPQPGLDEVDPPDAEGEKGPLVPFATTLLVRDTCLCLHVQRAARMLARRFDDALRPAGLTNSQFSLLMALNRPAPPPMGPVAALLAMDRTTLTAALKRLEARGLVQVMRDPADRRSRLLALTQAGQALLARATPIWQESHARLEASLADGQVIRLRQDLAALG
ncbi:winged helix-turn-helix transcriptional regulator [Labrys sp. LIt4]|uniref:MarR family transcriptional regulator n=1 Tax=Labrys okinawensis TaxID=346911 RepID=A0A2S9Q5G4_9HYPH|nr:MULTISPECIES: MarR family winged helix-turn-helix transcriptional regulator [Labrys]MBP0581415.1 winged helix-turn-helix transcriptional regulator [Labrys sp. LIt4]PRH84599.1 MarR family transcriptional regulator [Labrys okinawensis]